MMKATAIVGLLLLLAATANAQPTLTSLSGCNGAGSTTTGCPRMGGIVLTLGGTNLGASGGLVLVGGVLE